MHIACAWNHIDVVDILLHYGANLEIRDSEGYTPLFYAVMYGHMDLVQKLRSKGANIDVSDNNGKYLVTYAWKKNLKRMLTKPTTSIVYAKTKKLKPALRVDQ